jgi:glutaredoxin
MIDPKPYVVELDQHEIGADLQSLLAELTGRRTVPNVLVNGVSIGGGDDVAELDVTKQLVSKINELGSKKILGVKERPVEAPKAEAVAAAGEAHGLR